MVVFTYLVVPSHRIAVPKVKACPIRKIEEYINEQRPWKRIQGPNQKQYLCLHIDQFAGIPPGAILQHSSRNALNYHVECGVVPGRGSDLGPATRGVYASRYVKLHASSARQSILNLCMIFFSMIQFYNSSKLLISWRMLLSRTKLHALTLCFLLLGQVEIRHKLDLISLLSLTFLFTYFYSEHEESMKN